MSNISELQADARFPIQFEEQKETLIESLQLTCFDRMNLITINLDGIGGIKSPRFNGLIMK